MREAEIQKRLMTRLRTKFPGIYVRKIAQGPYSQGGIPDLLGCLNGMFFAIEVKTGAGQISKLQELEIKAITSAKGLALVCYDITDFDYIITRLKEYEQ